MRNEKKLDARATRFLVKRAFERKQIDSATFDALMGAQNSSMKTRACKSSSTIRHD